MLREIGSAPPLLTGKRIEAYSNHPSYCHPTNEAFILKAKKSYGQHFLKSENTAARIAASLQLTDTYDQVLEIGPGRGMLTKFLLDQPYALFVVEADPDMVHYLKKQFPDLKEYIIAGDFLKVPLPAFMGTKPFGLIGNFPYNISSQILFRMLEYRQQIPEMVGMFQKEVAERIISPPGSKVYGVISVLIQAYYQGEYLFTVDKSQFIPPPKVQSAVIRLTRRENLHLDCDEALFRIIVKQAFGQRRKMLRNTMKSFLPAAALTASPLFQKRPEQLTVADFIQLTRTIEMFNDSSNI